MKTITRCSLTAFLSFATTLPAAADGIFADIQTSMGAFSAELHYTTAPQTVANFITLAEGTRAWVDPTTGAVRPSKRFYDGLIFHRVIKDFMNQGGCPLGTGSSGPGYQFRDELAGGLLHDVPYRLSMANSGYNTNGSQFFVTVKPTPWLDGKHTVFGTVTQGQAVVDAINAVPTSGSPNDRPLTPVVIQTVTIRREGAAAEGFNVHAQRLPACGGSLGRLAVEKGVAAVWHFSQPLGDSEMFKAFRSPDLKTWTFLGEVYCDPGQEPAADITLDQAQLPRAFYQLPTIRYPGAMGTTLMANRTLLVQNGNQQFICRFDATGQAGEGELTDDDDSKAFTFTLYQVTATPWTNDWIVNTSEFGYLRVRGAMDTETATHFTGRRIFEQWNGFFWQELSSNDWFTLTK